MMISEFMRLKATQGLRLTSRISLLLLLAIMSMNSFAGGSNGEKFKPGEMILHHIGDGHDWHILDYDGADGEKHALSLPLPIIVYADGQGLSVFMSSAFDHGKKAHNGYRLLTDDYIAHAGLDKKDFSAGKIVAVDAQDHVVAGTYVWDLSITKNVAALLFSIIVMAWLFLSVAKTYKRRAGLAPKGLQNLLEIVILFVRDDIARPSIGEKKYEKFMPYLLTLFFFIWINNILGLIPILPGGANVTGAIAVPIVLATFTFVIMNINGSKHYWGHIFNMPGVPKPILLIVTPIEILGIFIKPLVLIIRLFANITAGHIVLLVFFSLIFIAGEAYAALGWGVSVASVAFTIFLNCLELLVGAIQAYVFTLLSAIYFGMAVEESH